MGRDIIATVKDGNGAWDEFPVQALQRVTQAGRHLGPSWSKLVFYSLRGDYTYPRRYFFVAPEELGRSCLTC